MTDPELLCPSDRLSPRRLLPVWVSAPTQELPITLLVTGYAQDRQSSKPYVVADQDAQILWLRKAKFDHQPQHTSLTRSSCSVVRRSVNGVAPSVTAGTRNRANRRHTPASADIAIEPLGAAAFGGHGELIQRLGFALTAP